MEENRNDYQQYVGGVDWECRRRLLLLENEMVYIQDSFQHLNATVFQCRVHPALLGWTLQEYIVLWGLALTFVIILQLVGDGKIIKLRVVQLFTSADVAAAGGGEAAPPAAAAANNDE